MLMRDQKSNNILQIVNKIQETINKEQLIYCSSNILLSISGGQDSIFLLFCLSFLQSQIDFQFKIIWCNHFWQIDSFYTTLHLTKSAHAFSSPIIGFIPLHIVLSLRPKGPSFANAKRKGFFNELRSSFSLSLSPKGPNFATAKPKGFSKKPVSNFLGEKTNRFSLRENYEQSLLENRFSLRENQLSFATAKPRLYKAGLCNGLCSAYKSSICMRRENRRQNRFFLRKNQLNFALKSSAFEFPFFAKQKSLRKPARPRLYKAELLCKRVCSAERKKNRLVFFTKKLEASFLENWKLRFLKASHLTDLAHAKQSKALKKIFWAKKFTQILSEAKSRNWRHITIERACTFYNSDQCVYGHTLSDRIETILFNLIRGAGSNGATPLSWKRRHSSFCYNKFYPCLEQVRKNTHINFL